MLSYLDTIPVPIVDSTFYLVYYLNYVDLDINATSEVRKIKDVSVSYAEVVIPISRKKQPIKNNQQIDKNDQEKNAASLKVGCSNLIINFIW